MSTMFPGDDWSVHNSSGNPTFEEVLDATVSTTRRSLSMTGLEAWRYAVEEGASVAVKMDEAAAQAPTRGAWQCGEGCDACCHLMVRVTTAEVDALVPRITDAIAERVRGNAELVRGLDAGAYRRARPRCAFLDESGRCSVYDVRPVRCRSHVSGDLATCLRVRDGDEPSGAVPGDAWLRAVASAVQAGLGGETRELHEALCARLGS